MKLSHTRVECFLKCPYQYKLRYVDKLETLPTDDPTSPLILGHALHTGIEHESVDEAIKEYYAAYPVISDEHVDEAIKLEYWLPKIIDTIPKGGLHEVKIMDDDFIGFIDYLVPVDHFANEYDLYDWKYSNNVQNYMDSDQLHLYKYYFEKLNPGMKIRNMYFMFVPKCQLRLKRKQNETRRELRKRIYADLDKKFIQFVKIDYDPYKVIEFLTNGKHAVEADVYDKNPTRLCDWCEFKRYCEKEDDLDMALPSTQRRAIEPNAHKKIWFYGAPFSGKTYLADKFPTPLMLNTDGNYKQVTAPVQPIVDEVKVEGRITKRKYAWEVFKEAVSDLEKGSDFETIILDLTEDIYDSCRIKVCVDNGWDHESDDSFKAYDIVRSEFLRTMRRLINLPYNIILISHEDMSKDIMKKQGDKITAIKPNINDKVANKLAGMVDICCRIINDEGKRTISFKNNEVVFGGGRLNITAKDIPCEYEALMAVYAGDTPTETKQERAGRKPKLEVKTAQEVLQMPTETEEVEVMEEPKVEEPVVPKRKKREAEVVETIEVDEVACITEDEKVYDERLAQQVEEAKPRRTRRRRTAE